jgi:DNA-binding response OmpR family regulator
MHSQPIVLVIESEPCLQLTMCATLMRMGVAPQRAGSVDAGLAILGSAPVNAVVLNAQLPDALDLLTFLRATAEYRHVPVLLYTSEMLPDTDAEITRRQGAEVFFAPDEYCMLIDRVREVLDFALASAR